MSGTSCRICLGGGNLVSRCDCREASWFHDKCLVKWVRRAGANCEICGKPYRGLEQRTRVWRVAPTQVVAVCTDCGATLVSIYGLWWLGAFGALKTVFILWWIICGVTGRAAARARRLGPAWRIQARTYRLLPASSRN